MSAIKELEKEIKEEKLKIAVIKIFFISGSSHPNFFENSEIKYSKIIFFIFIKVN